MSEHKELREEVKILSTNVKRNTNWLLLGKRMEAVKSNEYYIIWGYKTFSEYADAELDLAKSVVSDILTGVKFVSEHFPHILASAGANEDSIPVPGYNEAARLRRARNKIDAAKFERLKKSLFAGSLSRNGLCQELSQLCSSEASKNRRSLKDEVETLRDLLKSKEAEVELLRIDVAAKKEKIDFLLLQLDAFQSKGARDVPQLQAPEEAEASSPPALFMSA